jgi:DNA-binding NarL/FixJ family response regulator
MNFKRRIAIVESDKVFLDSYTHIVNNSDKYVVVGSYLFAEDLLKEVIQKKIEIVLMNIDLLGLDGVRATEMLKEKYPHVDIIIVTSCEETDFVINSLKAGASGYIERNSNFIEIISALDQLAKGGAPISPKIAKIVIHYFHLNVNSPLSNREKEVLTQMAEGKTYTQISDVLFISPETVRTHIRNIYVKLQVSNKSEAIKIGMDNKYF